MAVDPPAPRTVSTSRISPALAPGLLATLLAALLAAPATAQHEEPPEPAAYALEDVTLVTPDGATREGLTLVVREALLETAAAGAEVPADAKVLEGDSLFVYPGLVDLDGDSDLSWPTREEDGEEARPVPWDPTREQEGFTPQRRAADALTRAGADLAESREAGVVASAVHPEDGLAPGRGVLLLHRTDANTPGGLVLEPELAPILAFDAADRVYPSTHFAVLAFLRQHFEDAARHEQLVAAHRRDPRGLEAPTWDPALSVLGEAEGEGGRVFFRADRAQDIRQVLDLADRFGLRPVLVGGEEAWKLADRLAREDVPVAVSLDFPTPKRWDPEAGEEQEDAPDAPQETEPGEEPGGGQEAAPPEAGEELEPEVLREKRRIEDAYSNAGRLAEAGVRIALTSGGGEADLRGGVRTAMDYGLSESAALRALTTTPADLLGVPWLPRVEAGRPATFVVTDGPIFEEETEIRYAFVEGRLQVGAKPGAEPEEPPAVDVTGNWEMEMEGAMGTFAGDLSLEQEGASFGGTMNTQFGEAQVENGVVSGNEVSFTIVMEAGGQTIRIDLSGTASSDEMSGSGSGPPQMGSFTWEASRTGPGRGDVR